MEHEEIKNIESHEEKKQKIEVHATTQESKVQTDPKTVLVEGQKVEAVHPPSTQQQPPVQNNQQNEAAEQPQDDNESNWTDATESIAALDEDDIWVVDDDIVEAMEFDSEAEDIEQGQEQEKQEKQQASEGGSQNQEGKPRPKGKKENDIDFEELEDQFVKGNQSNEDWRLGQHEKFCTYVAVTKDGKNVFTGGGDDIMLCFRQVQGEWKEFYRLKHTETISKIQVSHDDKYVISSTENEAYCTEIATASSVKFEIDQPSDIACHKQGGIVVIANEYTISIYNLKGLSFFTSYTLDLPPTIISFCDKGKQIVAACDNKLRIITPKSGEIVKGSGEFHKEEISAMAVGNNMVYTGCIEGNIFATSLAKGIVTARAEKLKGAINLLALTDNNQYLMVAPQGEGVLWIETTNLKKIHHNPKDVSITDIVQVHQPNLYAFSELSGKIHIIDRKKPSEIRMTFEAGNTVHKLTSRGSLLYAACEDGFMRVFDVAK